MIEKLHRFFPEAELDILVRKGNESLYQNHPFIRTCLFWEKKNRKYKNLFSLLKQIRNEKYDAVINLQRFAASGVLTAFSGAKVKSGFNKNPLSFLFNIKKDHVVGVRSHRGLHEVDRCLSLIEDFTDNSSQLPKLYPSRGDLDFVKKWQVENYMTISPASVWFTKQVPTSEWIALIECLSPQRIWLLGAKGDRDWCLKLAKGYDHVGVLAGELSFLQSAALMAGAKMNFTSDSAPLHLCSAMNAPVTAAFCSTIPEFGFGPLSSISFIVETKELLDCRPCGLHGHRECPKGHFKCGQLHLNEMVNRITQSAS